MFIVGDKVKVRTTEQVGIVQELRSDNEVCVEFDRCEATQTCFQLSELELIRPGNDPSADVEAIQADKGL